MSQKDRDPKSAQEQQEPNQISVNITTYHSDEPAEIYSCTMDVKDTLLPDSLQQNQGVFSWVYFLPFLFLNKKLFLK